MNLTFSAEFYPNGNPAQCLEESSLRFHGGDEESGNVFVVETRAKAGAILESHQHAHGHLSVLVSGTAEVTIDGVPELMTGYRMVTIPANTVHKIQAVTDVIWLCLWADDLADKQQAEDSLKLVGCCGN